MKRLIIAMLLVTSLLVAVVAAAQEGGFKIVVNQSNPTSALTREQVARVFLKKMTSWENSQRIQPIDQPENASIREQFSESVLDKSVSAVNSYWQRMIFSGGGTPPVIKANDAEVLAMVRDNPGAVGYVTSSADVSGVKVLQLAK